MTLGEKIQQLRKTSGISQEQLAEQLDVSRQSVSKWELNDAIPDVKKIVMISKLFSISTDELLKENNEDTSYGKDSHSSPTSSKLEDVAKLNLAHKQIIIGFSSVIGGLILLIVEFMFLPIFGRMQKEQVDGQGFFLNFIDYAKVQPMPIIFFITFLMIIMGIIFMMKGFLYKKEN